MTAILAKADVERFSVLVKQGLGLHFDDGKQDFLADLLRQRLLDGGGEDVGAYFRRLSLPIERRRELRTLAEQLTVGETYFFRNRDHFRVFTEVVLPERMRAQGKSRHLRILSAGCATGEEAYTLAILLRDQLPDLSAWRVSIHGIDVNPSMIEKAKQARYSAWSLRETSVDVRDRYFRSAGRELVLDPDVRSMVSFEERNLVEDAPSFWLPNAFDVVFCRNVTMYFSLDVSRAVIARVAGALVPGGYLFLGHAETLRGVSNQFHLRHTHGAFYYQNRDSSETEVTPVWGVPACAADELYSTLGVRLESDDSWVDVIGRASERIARLACDSGRTAPRIGSAVLPKAAPGSKGPWDLGLARELMREERFADALCLLQGLPAESHTDPDAQLLRAVLLANGGKVSEAEAICKQILWFDELNAGAHYVMALSREHAGDRCGAFEHDQVAAYLDPGFAMPRLHFGLLARRSGDLEGALRELEQALILLAREDASRILLFGGGFNREALLQLCRAELRACRRTP